MEANDPQDEVNLNSRGMLGRIYDRGPLDMALY